MSDSLSIRGFEVGRRLSGIARYQVLRRDQVVPYEEEESEGSSGVSSAMSHPSIAIDPHIATDARSPLPSVERLGRSHARISILS